MAEAETPEPTGGVSARQTLAVLFVNTIGAAGIIGLTLVLAHTVGAQGLGGFQFAWAWIDLFVIVALLGVDKLAQRVVAVCVTREQWGTLRGFMRFGDTLAVVLSLLLAAAGAAVCIMLRGQVEPVMTGCLLIAMAALPWRALVIFRRGLMIGLGKPALGQLPEMLIQPGLTLAGVGLLWWLARDSLTGPTAVACSVAAAVAAWIIAMTLVRRAVGGRTLGSGPVYVRRAWMSAALPMFVIASLGLVNTRADVIMLALFKGASAAGVYTAAMRVAELLRFAMMAVNPVVAGKFARLHDADDATALQRVLTHATRMVFVPALVIAVLLAVFGVPILRFFGEGFSAGYAALIVLSAGILINLTAGMIETLLMMTGHGRAAMMGFAMSTAVNLALNFALIPRFGLVGAATATATAAVVWAGVLSWRARRLLGVAPGLLGRRGGNVAR